MKFAREPFLLHLLAGSDTVTALDAAKALLDAGTHDANEREPCDNLAPLHVAAAWGNLAMCQLLIHYGADVKSEDIDKRRPVDVAEGQCRSFLKRLGRKRRTERSKFGKVLSFLFRCAHPPATTTTNYRNTNAANNNDNIHSSLTVAELFDNRMEQRQMRNKSCPSTIVVVPNAKHNKNKISNVQPHLPSNGQRPMPTAPTLTPKTPRRSSSLVREAFLTDDNSTQPEVTDDELNMAKLETWRTARDDNDNGEDQFGKEEAVEDDEAEEMDDRGSTADDDQQQRQRRHDEAVIDALRHQFAALRIDELRERLLHRNCIAGPMNAANRRIYEAKLARLETRQNQQQKRDPNAIKYYSKSLRRLVMADERGNATEESQRIGRKEEAQILGEYAISESHKKEMSYFCYLLIDPSELPSASSDHFVSCTVSFRRFLSAIFYVGKGKRSRPHQHLVQASKCRDLATANPSERSPKLNRILSLWDNGNGVISLQLFCNIHSAEAHVREAAMIDAIGVDNLTNIVRGSFPGNNASNWSREQIANFGALLLHKAHAIFQHERCRPIRETELED